MNEGFGIKGKLNIKKFTGDKLIEEHNFENLITDIGLLSILKMIGGDMDGINNIGLGGGNTTASFSDTKLNNKLILVNFNKDYSEAGKIIFYATIPERTFSSTVAYKEAGLIQKSTNAIETLITRLVFSDVVYQNPENSLSLSYSLELKRGV